MGLVKTRRLAAMQKMQHAKFVTPPPVKKGGNMVMGARPGCGKQSPRGGR